MKTIILDETEVLYSNNTWLKNRLLVDKKDIENGRIADLFIDSDILRFNSNITYFVETHNKTTRYIITNCETETDENKVLTAFFDQLNKTSDPFTQLESSWDNFNDLKIGIAYRGGAGYSYDIYQYN